MTEDPKSQGFGQIADRLFFDVIAKAIPEEKRGLAIAQYLLGKGQLDSAELEFDRIIRERDRRDVDTVVRSMIGKAEILKRRNAFDLAHRVLVIGLERAASGPDSLRGAVALQQGIVCHAQADRDAALDRLTEAEALLATATEPAIEHVQVSLLLGMVHRELVDPAKAHERFRAGLDRARLLKDTNLELIALLGVAQTMSDLGSFRAALGACDDAAQVIEGAKGNAPHPLAVTLAELRAGAQQSLGELALANQTLEQALGDTADPKEQARLRSSLALLSYSMGNTAAARDQERRAQQITESLGSDPPEVLLNLSRLAAAHGAARKADELLFAAMLALPKKLDPLQRADLSLREIEVGMLCGRWREAREKAEKLNTEFPGSRAHALQSGLLNALGGLSAGTSAYDHAEECYRDLLSMADANQAKLMAAGAIRGLATVSMGRAEPKAAATRLEEARSLARECGAALLERSMLVELALAQGRMSHDLAEAIPVLEEGLSDSRLLENVAMETGFLVSLGSIELDRGNLDEAREYLDKALEKSADAGLEATRTAAAGILGCVHADLGDTPRARELLADALGGMDRCGIDSELRCHFQERYRDLTGFAHTP